MFAIRTDAPTELGLFLTRLRAADVYAETPVLAGLPLALGFESEDDPEYLEALSLASGRIRDVMLQVKHAPGALDAVRSHQANVLRELNLAFSPSAIRTITWDQYKREIITEDRIHRLLELGPEIRPHRGFARLGDDLRERWLREIEAAQEEITDQRGWRRDWEAYALVEGFRRLRLILKLLPLLGHQALELEARDLMIKVEAIAPRVASASFLDHRQLGLKKACKVAAVIVGGLIFLHDGVEASEWLLGECKEVLKRLPDFDQPSLAFPELPSRGSKDVTLALPPPRRPDEDEDA